MKHAAIATIATLVAAGSAGVLAAAAAGDQSPDAVCEPSALSTPGLETRRYIDWVASARSTSSRRISAGDPLGRCPSAIAQGRSRSSA